MSDALAIAAVTTTLRNLLQEAFDAEGANVRVTTQPPDKIETTPNGNRVNLFLYHLTVNPHWRNRDVPWRVKPGEQGREPLPLNLYYLVTAYYGESEAGVDTITDSSHLLGSHRLLGRAMSVLHDRMMLNASSIQAALPTSDRTEHVYDQVEKVRITPQPLSLDEMSKLWTGFQTQQRPSAAYEVSVVLIESTLPGRTPLPVLTRGEEDRGADAQATLLPPFPTLTAIRFPSRQPAVRLGETMALVGHHLASESVTVRCANRRAGVTNEITVPEGTSGHTDSEIPVAIPDEPAAWPAGHYTVEAMIYTSETLDRTTNALAFTLAPQITPPSDPIPPTDGEVEFMVTCRPQIRADQQVVLLFGDRQIEPNAITTPEPPGGSPPATDPTASTSLTFTVDDVASGDEVWLRLRVDGVDSLLIDFSKDPAAFDESQKVTIS